LSTAYLIAAATAAAAAIRRPNAMIRLVIDFDLHQR
jgi:hypothetical protein